MAVPSADVNEYPPSAVCHPASLRRPWVYPSREIAQRNRDAPYFGVGKVRLRIDRVLLNIFRALGWQRPRDRASSTPRQPPSNMLGLVAPRPRPIRYHEPPVTALDAQFLAVARTPCRNADSNK